MTETVVMVIESAVEATTIVAKWMVAAAAESMVAAVAATT